MKVDKSETMYTQILKDKMLDEALDQKGYVVVPFLNAEEVKALVDLFEQTHPIAKEGLYASAHAESYELKKGLSDGIMQQFSRAVNEIFYECRPLGGSYIVKYKGERGVLYPHQDWGIVDEDNHRSFNIWVPLVDTTEDNGAISVLPASHKLIKSYRGVNIPDPYYKSNSHAWKFHETLLMKAGQALIYDHRLLHASAVNTTDKARMAVVFGIISQKAELRYFYRNGDKVELYEIDVDYFFNNDFQKGPNGLKKVKEVDYDFPVVSDEEFDFLYFGKARPKQEAAVEVIKETASQNVPQTEQQPKSIFKKFIDWLAN